MVTRSKVRLECVNWNSYLTTFSIWRPAVTLKLTRNDSDRLLLCPSLLADLVTPVTDLRDNLLWVAMTWLVSFRECPESHERQGHHAQGPEATEHPNLLRQWLQAEHAKHAAAAEDWCVVFVFDEPNPIFLMTVITMMIYHLHLWSYLCERRTYVGK